MNLIEQVQDDAHVLEWYEGFLCQKLFAPQWLSYSGYKYYSQIIYSQVTSLESGCYLAFAEVCGHDDKTILALWMTLYAPYRHSKAEHNQR